jgi:glycosyltransferase involved in cell wall biosynthesis
VPPRFSVVIAVRNCEPFIGAAIDSVLAQTSGDFELLVSDDDSDDGTCAVVARYMETDARIRLLRHRPEGGAGGNRNHAMAHARGDWIAFLDGDDIWAPNHLQSCAAAIDVFPDAVLVFGDFRRFVASVEQACTSRMEEGRFFDPGAAYVREVATLGDGTEVFRLHSDQLLKHCCLQYCPISTCGTVLRREVMQASGLEFRGGWTINEDFDLWMKMLERGPAVAIRRVLFYYRERPGSLTSSTTRYYEGMAISHGTWFARICDRLSAAEQLTYRAKLAGFLQALAWQQSLDGRVAAAGLAHLGALRYQRRVRDVVGIARTLLRASYRRFFPGRSRG